MRIPTKWQQVTLGQFMELKQLNTQDLDNFDLTNEQIAVLCGVTQQDVMRMTVELRNKIVERLSFIESEPVGEFNPKFWHNRKRWAVTDNIKKLKGGQYIDIAAFIKQGTSNNYHNILAVICTPMRFGLYRSQYDSDKVFKHADEFLSLPVPIALSIAAFFLSSLEIYIDNMQTFLEGAMEEMLTNEVSSIDSDGT
jgi:hypothetical protein